MSNILKWAVFVKLSFWIFISLTLEHQQSFQSYMCVAHLNSKSSGGGRRAAPTSTFVPNWTEPSLDSTSSLNPPGCYQVGPLALTCFLRLGKQRAVHADHPDHVYFAASVSIESQERNKTGRSSTFRGRTWEGPISTRRVSWIGIHTPLIIISLILGESLNFSEIWFPDL